MSEPLLLRESALGGGAAQQRDTADRDASRCDRHECAGHPEPAAPLTFEQQVRLRRFDVLRRLRDEE